MEIREGMKKVIQYVATGTSIAALVALGATTASAADLDSEPLTAGYSCPGPESGCGGKDKKDKKDEGKKDEGKKDEGKKGKKEGKCGEGKCGEGKCG